MFIDQVKIKVQSGNGGNGTVAWRREKYVPKGGPAGGDGGKGGDVILVADPNISTLLEFKYKSSYEAEHGENGRSKNCYGQNGKDLKIKVPVGTLVKDINTDSVIADLTEDGQEVIVAQGGRGGRGNSHFATSTRQAPQFCEPGESGIYRELELELKLLADVGLIGLPNAGKSTLISVVSAARPKIADYPFTTLIPNLGVHKSPDGQGIVIADIPGLIEGASEGAGLGHQFLRHVERTRLLIHMLDCMEENPVNNYNVINKELAKYSDYLSSLEQIICINKIDSQYQEIVEEIKDKLSSEDKKIFVISAVTGQGVQDLMNHVVERLSQIPKEYKLYELVEDFAAFDHDDSEFTVYRKNKAFFVEGGKVKRLVQVTNITNNESVHHLHKILTAMGVFNALKEAGAKDGDMVHIGHFEFEYYDVESI